MLTNNIEMTLNKSRGQPYQKIGIFEVFQQTFEDFWQMSEGKDCYAQNKYVFDSDFWERLSFSAEIFYYENVVFWFNRIAWQIIAEYVTNFFYRKLHKYFWTD